MTFDEWFYKPGRYHIDSSREIAKQAWDAATEEVKKDHFKIGEEVEMDGGSSRKATVRAVIDVKDGVLLCIDRSLVHRIPAWEPKDGETVLAKSKSGKAFYAVSAGGIDIYDNSCLVSGILEAYDIKPWKPDCQGKPWDEV